MVTRENGTTTIPDWQLGVAAFLLVTFSGAVATWVWSEINDHQHRLNEHDTVLATHTQQLRSIESQGDKVDVKLTRIDEKIDRLFEEMRKK
jgi:peptidoglycan hydrolase CwlO-like protein